MVSIPSRFRGRARRDAAAFYLSELARGILAGELGVRVGHETLPVQPTDFLVLEIAVTQKSHTNQVSVRVRWPRRRGPGGVAAGERRGRPLPEQSRAGTHVEFTRLSSERNPEARDSHPDARHR